MSIFRKELLPNFIIHKRFLILILFKFTWKCLVSVITTINIMFLISNYLILRRIKSISCCNSSDNSSTCMSCYFHVTSRGWLVFIVIGVNCISSILLKSSVLELMYLIIVFVRASEVSICIRIEILQILCFRQVRPETHSNLLAFVTILCSKRYGFQAL